MYLRSCAFRGWGVEGTGPREFGYTDVIGKTKTMWGHLMSCGWGRSFGEVVCYFIQSLDELRWEERNLEGIACMLLYVLGIGALWDGG